MAVGQPVGGPSCHSDSSGVFGGVPVPVETRPGQCQLGLGLLETRVDLQRAARRGFGA